MNRHLKSAFTLVELLVVIAIIGVLLGLMLPATQSMREMARRSQCQNNLLTLSLALSAYHDAQGAYPVGTLNPAGPIESLEAGYHHNWLSALLPQLELATLSDKIDTSVGVYATENAIVRKATIATLICPSASGVNLNTTCYAGIHHSLEAPIDTTNNGVFILNRATNDQDITDGLSYTLFLGEKVSVPDFDFGWISGTRSTLRNTGHPLLALDGTWPNLFPASSVQSDQNQIIQDTFDVPVETTPTPVEVTKEVIVDLIRPLFVGGLQSDHPGGTHLLVGSGAITFSSSSMDTRVLQQMANKANGGIPISVLDEELGNTIRANQSLH